MSDFTIKSGDTLPSIEATLKDDTDTVVDLTGSAVRFHLSSGTSKNNTNVIDAPAVIVNAAGGVVRYDWQTGDTDTPGKYVAEWEVTFGPGAIETFPNGADLTVNIFPELA